MDNATETHSLLTWKDSPNRTNAIETTQSAQTTRLWPHQYIEKGNAEYVTLNVVCRTYRTIPEYSSSCCDPIDEPGLQANNLAYRELSDPFSSPQMLLGLEMIFRRNYMYALPISIGESLIRWRVNDISVAIFDVVVCGLKLGERRQSRRFVTTGLSLQFDGKCRCKYV